jgi:HPt (histidine-containing phosphotransfer) domain-containing protein
MERSDHDKLVEEIGEESALEMLDVFLRETVARLTLLNRLACPNDCLQIEREAHSLKSTSRVFGLKRLSALARALEVAASDLSDAEFRVSLDQIERAFDEARAQLSAQFTTPT